MAIDMDESGLHLERLRRAVLEVSGAALVKALTEKVLPMSTQLVPKDDGDLAESAKVTGISDTTASIHYPGPYARKQHELLGFKHLGGGSAKFLEIAMKTEGDNALQVVADEIKKAL